jgi:hypothetical protein
MKQNDVWANLEEAHCPCQGTGWAQMEDESWENCFLHFEGQLHPESKLLLLDDAKKLKEEERRSHLRWKIQKARSSIQELNSKLKNEQAMLVAHELELINKTPTIKMAVVIPEELVLELDDSDLVEDDVPPAV